ncbi:CLUMA_CG015301, isoform A [Clunio marinus]|uniref:CLUMA_CG015301, isoform A n=1 Tax=Clunio marinus TaxID=568069 RepID=A0A1J1IRD3_9DIPT|nr:CLUMA_CG015301, isoform A [Clunio marinus]
MPFKCSVKGCRSNYDSTKEKVSIFQFPADIKIQEEWLKIIEISNSSVTNSSRVCAKHFDPKDIDTSARRTLLKPTAIPIYQNYDKQQAQVSIQLDNLTEQEFCEILVKDECDDVGDIIPDFGYFCNQLEVLESLENWNMYIESRGVCLYRLSCVDDGFSDVVMKMKVLINNQMLKRIDSLKEELKIIYDELNNATINYEIDSLEEFIEELEEFSDISVDEKLSSVTNMDFEHHKNDTEFLETSAEVCMTDDSKNAFKCGVCSFSFLTLLSLRSHKESCKKSAETNGSKKKINICTVCGKTFQKAKSLKEHEKLHDSNYRKKCSLCDAVIYARSLKRHMDTVHKKLKSFQCKMCSKRFSTLSLKREHEKRHKQNFEFEKYSEQLNGFSQYNCPNCTLSYENSSSLRKHMQKDCQANEKKRIYRYPCKKCSKTFFTKISAAKHMKVEHQIVIKNTEKFCFLCNEEFEDYVNHVRLHSCNFSCQFCGSKFLTQEKALNHEKLKHSDETIADRPFKCPENDCTLSFKNPNHLKSHQLAIHNNTHDREFQCNECNKKFTLRYLLTAHLRSHNKNFAMFPCNIQQCNRRFKKLNNLKIHALKFHGIPEIYLCKECDQRFMMLKDLKYHLEDEHNQTCNIQKYFNC